jgi:hypothetical protein
MIKTAIAVKQDIYAKIMMMNLCAGLAFPIEEKVIKEYREAKKNRKVKHRRKINRTLAYWTTKVTLIAIFIKRRIKAALSVFDKQVEANTEADRPDRHSPRKKKPSRLYHVNYKDLQNILFQLNDPMGDCDYLMGPPAIAISYLIDRHTAFRICCS